MAVSAKEFSMQGDKYIGTSYQTMDCQKFVERMMKDVGINKDLAGSNAWFRYVTWTGTPEQCKAIFGTIPVGALLFIWKDDGGEKQRGYHDGLGNASHIGVYIAREDGAIHSSSSRGQVCYSKFNGKSINGGWNRVGLWDAFDYGSAVNNRLSYISNAEQNEKNEQKEVTTVLYTAKIKSANGKGANLRSKKSTSSTLLIAMPEGETVEVLEELGDWCRVDYDGTIGYVLKKLLVPQDLDTGDKDGDDFVTVKLPYLTAIALRDALFDVLGAG